MLRLGFVVEKKRDNEATLRAYVRERLTYPLLNPRFVRRTLKGLKGATVLEIIVLSKGHESLEHRLAQLHPVPPLTFEVVGEWQSPYFVHGRFLMPLTFQGARTSPTLNIAALEPALRELLKYLA